MPKQQRKKHIPSGNKQFSKNRRKKQRNRIFIIAAAVIILAAVGLFLFFRFQTFSEYKVLSRLELSNTDEQTKLFKYNGGFVRSSSEGVTYFDSKGIHWAESFEMTQPLTAVSGAYFAVADMKGKDVFLYDVSGLANRITLSHNITDLEVSNQGIIAVATNEGDSNYIEVVDKEGNELVTAKSVFASSGYLMDIALSPDGSKLAAAFVYVSEGTLESKVVFYDFSNGNGGEDMVVGGFNQYKSTILASIHFMEKGKVCVVGDNAISIYDFNSTPELVYENLNLGQEIQSIFYSDKYLGMVVEDEEGETNYCLKVLDMKGKEVLSKGFDFAYNKALFAGRNVLLYSKSDCEMYSFSGVKKMELNMEDSVFAMNYCGKGTDFVLASSSDTEFIRLK
ncbi:MAG: DUF5711 family protein [Lachnospiraceae bacterium]|nr:DUF5711 family protein [Lachnospiraceae bacterium]